MVALFFFTVKQGKYYCKAKKSKKKVFKKGLLLENRNIREEGERFEFRTSTYFSIFLAHCELDRQVLRKEYRQKGL